MKLLIAGGAGYLGSALIPKLLERQYTVDVVDLFWFGNRSQIARSYHPQND